MFRMTDANNIFDHFGGVRSMARALGVSPSSVMGWKRERRIPAQQQPAVLEVGATLGLLLTAEDVVFPFGRPTASIDAALGDVPCGETRKTQNNEAGQ